MTAEHEPDDPAGTPVGPVEDEIPHLAFFEQARRPLPDDDCAERGCKALAEWGYELRSQAPTVGRLVADAAAQVTSRRRRPKAAGAGE